MKHIVLYINSMAPSGGIERVIATLAKNFSSKLKVTILVKDKLNSFYELPQNVEIKTLDYELKLNMNSRFSRIITLTKHLFGIGKVLNNKFEELNADFIYITSPYACLEILLSKIPKNKVIISEHGARVNYNLVYRWMKNVLYKKFPIHVVPTITDYNWYINRGFPSILIPHFRSNLQYNICDLDSKKVLNIGRLTNDKNQLGLLKIWFKVTQNEIFNEWKLQIVGKGENYDILNNFISEKKLNNVEIIEPTLDIEKIYINSSIYVSTSRSEGYPMVLIEALSFGLPTIAFNCPTGPDEILINDSGVLVELNDEDNFINKLSDLMSNENLRKKLSENALLRSNDWDDEKIMSRWYHVFN